MDNPTANMDGHDADMAAFGRLVAENARLREELAAAPVVQPCPCNGEGCYNCDAWDKQSVIAAAEGKHNANVCGLPHGKESK